jgi:hypothetical protein
LIFDAFEVGFQSGKKECERVQIIAAIEMRDIPSGIPL